MNFKLKIWRQKNRQTRGKLVDYEVREISPDTSFLEMLDILNENLLRAGEEPVAISINRAKSVCDMREVPSAMFEDIETAARRI